ncbi:MAG: Ig-like domain-containing protein, partial [Candidatus Sericytochromatia bacterium]
RRRVEVLKSNKTGDPNANRYDFGTDDGDESDFGVEYNALSDKPEVVSVTPSRNASGIAPDTSFVLEFSESMDTDTVEENFGVYTATDEEFSVGIPVDGVDGDSPTDGLHLRADGFSITEPDPVDETRATLIWDESAFSVDWNDDDTEVTFTFTDEQQLPTDTESSNVPDYLVSLSGVDDGQIKDESGVTRDTGDGGYFKLTDGNFEMWYEFSIDTDEEEPQVDSVTAINGSSGNDEIEVEFSEPMLFSTRGGQISGMGDESPLNPANYMVRVTTSNNVAVLPATSLDVLNGSVRFDSDDETNSTVILSSPGFEGFTVGSTVPNNDETATVTVYYVDGSTPTTVTLEEADLGAPGASYADIADSLSEEIFGTTTGNHVVTMTEVTDGGIPMALPGAMSPSDVYTVFIEDGAMRGGKEVAFITASGELAEAVGLDDQTIRVGESTEIGDSLNLFGPGDRVYISVDSSVVDPAGNSVDSENDEEDDSAN